MSHEQSFRGTFNEYLTSTSSLPSTGRSSRELFYSTVTDAISKSNYQPTVYKEMLRALISQMNLRYVDSRGEPIDIKLHHGRQDRAVAKKFQENNIILPYASVFQYNVQNDVDRRRFDSLLVQNTRWNHDTLRAERVLSFPDVPVKLSYLLNVWTRYVSDMDQIAAIIRNKFNPSFELRTPFSTNVTCFLSDETDNSVVEVSDREDRLIRKGFFIEIQTYIPSPKFRVTNTGRIEEIVFESQFLE